MFREVKAALDKHSKKYLVQDIAIWIEVAQHASLWQGEDSWKADDASESKVSTSPPPPDHQRYPGLDQARVKVFHISDTIYARNFTSGLCWKEAKAVAVTEPASHKIQLDNEEVHWRYWNHLRMTWFDWDNHFRADVHYNFRLPPKEAARPPVSQECGTSALAYPARLPPGKTVPQFGLPPTGGHGQRLTRPSRTR